MGVGADTEPVDVFTEVHVLVLMTQDREAGLGEFGVAADEFGNLVGLGVLVRQRQQRHVHADHRTDFGTPEPRARHHDVGGNRPVGRRHAGNAATTLLDPRDLGGSAELCAACLGAAGDCDNDPRCFGKPVGRRIQPAQDL